MPPPDRTLADRARLLLRASGGRAKPADLLIRLFGSSADPERWGVLLDNVLTPLPDVCRTAEGDWELRAAAPRGVDSVANASFVALATAATSGDPWRARLVALAAVRVERGQPVGRFEAVFNPRCRLPRYVMAATGITQGEAEEAPPFAELAQDLLDFLGSESLVGIEITAQAEVIGHELSRLDLPSLRNPLLDLSRLAEQAGLAARPNLAALAAAAGLSHPRPYRPSTDARVAAQLATRLANRLHPIATDTSAALADLRESDEPRSGPLLNLDQPDAPPGPGVYVLRDAADTILYVGKARNLRSRVGAYHRRQLGLLRRLEGLAAAVVRVETLPTRTELEALILEARLLRRYCPAYNTQRTRRPAALFLRADRSELGAGLTSCRQPLPDGGHYLGPCRTTTGAAGAVRLLRQLFPALKGRARSGAAERRPLVEAALRFLAGDKDAVLDQLQAEQRRLARNGNSPALEASRSLLRHAIAFSLDLAACDASGLNDRLLVLSAAPGDTLMAYLLQDGRLLACFEAESEADAVEQAARKIALTAPGSNQPGEAADEQSIVYRWLCALGPDYKILRL